MKYRGAAAHTGLGGNAETLMDCKTSGSEKTDELVRSFAKDVYDTFFKGTKTWTYFEGVDAQYRDYEVRAGVEPTYMYEDLKMITLSREKQNSYLLTGYAVGPWASAVRQTRKYYSEYKKHGKFVKFIDKWHPILFPVVNR